jgi:prepilin peptidase CpaA
MTLQLSTSPCSSPRSWASVPSSISALRRIPNWLTVPAAAMALLYHTLAPHGIGPLLALAGFAVGFSLLLLPWLLGGGGMGDVKMLAALGAWLGPLGILIAFGLGAVVAA